MYTAVTAQSDLEKELSYQSISVAKTLPHQFEMRTKKKKKKEPPVGPEIYDWSYLLQAHTYFKKTTNLNNLLGHTTDISVLFECNKQSPPLPIPFSSS